MDNIDFGIQGTAARRSSNSSKTANGARKNTNEPRSHYSSRNSKMPLRAEPKRGNSENTRLSNRSSFKNDTGDNVLANADVSRLTKRMETSLIHEAESKESETKDADDDGKEDSAR